MDKNIINDFPDAKILKCGEWSNYGKQYTSPDGTNIEIGLYREPMDNDEYTGHLTLHIFYNDDVICCCDMGK